MEINKVNNKNKSNNLGDFYIAGKSLVLNCPFCDNRFYFSLDKIQINPMNGKLTIKGFGLNPYIVCCKKYYIQDNVVIEL